MSIKKHTNLELIIFYYIRNEYENKFNTIYVPISLKYLILSFTKYIIGSSLLTIKQDINFVQILLTKIANISKFDLLFRASENGFTAKDFHNQCDNNGQTIIIIKSNFGNIFGGYTKIPWKSSEYAWKCDLQAFLFIIYSNNKLYENKCPLIFEIKKEETKYSVCHSTAFGPSFGSGRDLVIAINGNNNSVSPSSYNYGSFRIHVGRHAN